jgi:hypothetical protein
VRSEREKWQVPDSDPAGKAPDPGRDANSIIVPGSGSAAEPVRSAERAGLIYCGQCGALNPATNHYCAACGATIVDAFRATEGLRIYDRADTASRVIEIVPAGLELDLVDDPDAPSDFLRVKLEYGRLGYARVADIQAMAGEGARAAGPPGEPDINTNARGFVTQSGALLALLLLFMLTALTLIYIRQSDIEEQGIVALAACVTLGPLLLLTIAIFIYARSREEAAEEEVEEARRREAAEP